MCIRDRAYMLPGWATGAALRLPLPEGFWGAAGIVSAALAVMLLLIMQASLRERHWAASLAALLGAIALAAMLIGFPRLDSLDQGLMTLAQDERSAAFDPIAVFITRFGDFHIQFAAGVLLVALLFAARRWQAGLFVAGALLLASTATTVLKNLMARSRPDACCSRWKATACRADTALRHSPSSWPWVCWPVVAARRAHALPDCWWRACQP